MNKWSEVVNDKLYLQDHTSTYSIAKAIYNHVLTIRTKILIITGQY